MPASRPTFHDAYVAPREEVLRLFELPRVKPDPGAARPCEGIISELVPVVQSLKSQRAEAPRGGVAGHAGGNLIETMIRDACTSVFGHRVRRQHDVVNDLLVAHPEATSSKQRALLFGEESVQRVFANRDLKKWTAARPFTENQSDTADFVIFDDESCTFASGRYVLGDAKAVNLDKNGRAPNIISATKLYHVLVDAVRNGEVPFDILYVALGYKVTKRGVLVVKESRVISLFAIAEPLSINWKSAEQVQFHPLSVDQDFEGTPLDWANQFLDTYRASARRNIQTQTANLAACELEIHSARLARP